MGHSSFLQGIAANNWGKTRKNFYGTSHASKTDRVADSEEEEVLELEGEEAIIRQKRLDLVTSNVNFNHFGLEAFDSCACVEEILRLKRSIENTRKVRSSLSDVDPTQVKKYRSEYIKNFSPAVLLCTAGAKKLGNNGQKFFAYRACARRNSPQNFCG